MKIVIASDIHGSAAYCKRLVTAAVREKADKIVLLGDILYHGPRNDLPDEYNPKAVMQSLNFIKDKLLCVRGNCDAEVDQMVLDFPVMADYAVLFLDGKTVYATHGHLYGEDNPPPIAAGDILLCGHTHVPACREKNGFVYLNPGSVSIPKENSVHGYMVYENRRFVWKSLDGKEYNSYSF